MRWKKQEESEKKIRKLTSEIAKGKLHVFLPCFILICSGTANQYNMFITVFQSFRDSGCGAKRRAERENTGRQSDCER